MSLNFQAVENLASSSGVREGSVNSRGTSEARQLGVDLENQVFRFLVEMPIPQSEEQIGARLGKKNKETGVQNVTSNIFGKVSASPVYIQAPDGSTMEFTARLQAPVAGVSGEDTEEDDLA